MNISLSPDSFESTFVGELAGDHGDPVRPEQRLAALLLARYNLRYLVRLYAAFDGDLLLPIVLGEVGLYNIGRVGLDDQALTAMRNNFGTDFDSLLLRPCNAFSISSSTGIPRETVRRKVSHLIQLGFLARDQKGGLTITAKAASLSLQPFDHEHLDDLLSTAERVHTLLEPMPEASACPTA